MENHNPSSNATFPPSDSSLSELNRNLEVIKELNAKINKLPDTTKIIESVVFRSCTKGGKKDIPPSDSSFSELNRNLEVIKELNAKINNLPDTTKIIESVVFRSCTKGGKKDISHQSDYSCLDHESGGN